MRSVVDVITTRTPAAYSRRAMAKPIPSALPPPVIRAVCLFRGRVMEMRAEGIIHRLRKIAIYSDGRDSLLDVIRRGTRERTVVELASTTRGFLVADTSEDYGLYAA